MQALILAGGRGTRFWPLSRRHRPKQLLALEGELSLLQDTVERLAPLIPPSDVWICTTELLADAVREQLPEVPTAQILCEPEGRNTAPAIAWAIHCMPEEHRDGVIAVLPADHRFADKVVFRQVLEQAAECANRDGRVMALGVTPRWAETGYGYLELGAELEDGAREVACFREKPEAEIARQYFAGGQHLWNAGIFVFRGNTLLRHLTGLEPKMAALLEQIAATPERTAELYPTLEKISIDYAVMERLGPSDIATVPLDCGWSDLGSWQALAEIMPADESKNHSRGDVMSIDASGNLLFADEGTIAVVGVEDLVVVRTGDSVLVMPRERSQEVGELVKRLESQNRSELL